MIRSFLHQPDLARLSRTQPNSYEEDTDDKAEPDDKYEGGEEIRTLEVTDEPEVRLDEKMLEGIGLYVEMFASLDHHDILLRLL